MPASKVRKSAASKRKVSDKEELAAKRADRKRIRGRGEDRSWVPWVFIPVGIIGGLWLVTYYVAGYQIPGMRTLGDWNILIGMGLMAAAFALATLWK